MTVDVSYFKKIKMSEFTLPQDWQEASEEIKLSPHTDLLNLDESVTVQFSVWVKDNCAVILADTNGEFTDESQVNNYLRRFFYVIHKVRKSLPGFDLFFIQNYQDFRPDRYLEYIKKQAQENPRIISALEIIPFETHQVRVCSAPSDTLKQLFPGLLFAGDVEAALKQLQI